MSRVDQASLHVVVNGEDLGVWDKRTGGGRTADSTKFRPGNMGSPISLGGWPDTDNITLQRLFNLQRDHVSGVQRRLMALVGRGRVTATDQPLTPEGVPVGDPIVYNGTLVGCTPREADSESTDAALLEIVVEVDGEPS